MAPLLASSTSNSTDQATTRRRSYQSAPRSHMLSRRANRLLTVTIRSARAILFNNGSALKAKFSIRFRCRHPRHPAQPVGFVRWQVTLTILADFSSTTVKCVVWSIETRHQYPRLVSRPPRPKMWPQVVQTTITRLLRTADRLTTTLNRG